MATLSFNQVGNTAAKSTLFAEKIEYKRMETGTTHAVTIKEAAIVELKNGALQVVIRWANDEDATIQQRFFLESNDPKKPGFNVLYSILASRLSSNKELQIAFFDKAVSADTDNIGAIVGFKAVIAIEAPKEGIEIRNVGTGEERKYQIFDIATGELHIKGKGKTFDSFEAVNAVVETLELKKGYDRVSKILKDEVGVKKNDEALTKIIANLHVSNTGTDESATGAAVL